MGFVLVMSFGGKWLRTRVLHSGGGFRFVRVRQLVSRADGQLCVNTCRKDW